ncbi:MAG: hypothetical protein ABJM90_15690 [Paracoccaceae bacterium]
MAVICISKFALRVDDVGMPTWPSDWKALAVRSITQGWRDLGRTIAHFVS